MASAAMEMKSIAVLGPPEPSWETSIAWMTSLGIPYFTAMSLERSMCVPSISWSKALPISCIRVANLANRTSAPTWAAIIPAK